jgi:hypothetical protein
MRSSTITIVQVRKQNVTQMPFTNDHDVIEAFPSDRADQAFAMSILPRRAGSGWFVANAHRTQTSFKDTSP